jgi:hypothetical protein
LPAPSTGISGYVPGLLGDLGWLKSQRPAPNGALPAGDQGGAPATGSGEPQAQNDDAPAHGFDLNSLSNLQSRGLSLDPSKPIWAPGAVSASHPALSRTSRLPVSAVQAPQPPTSSGGQPSGAGQHQSAGILGALAPWAVPVPDGRTLKSAMVTRPDSRHPL